LNLTRRLYQCTPELVWAEAEDPISLRCWEKQISPKNIPSIQKKRHLTNRQQVKQVKQVKHSSQILFNNNNHEPRVCQGGGGNSPGLHHQDLGLAIDKNWEDMDLLQNGKARSVDELI